MVAFDATEMLMPYREGDGSGAILFDRERFRQVEITPAWLDSEHWGNLARPVDSGGRGGSWFVDAPFGPCVLREYKRGGLVANLSPDRYLWNGANQTRSFVEFRLTRELHQMHLPVPQPLLAAYVRQGMTYRAMLLMERLADVRSLGDAYQAASGSELLEETGRLVAKFHRVGLDHADLNAHNILFDSRGKGWLIDFDRCALRIPATHWREANLARLRRSLMKLRGERSTKQVDEDFRRLRGAYLHDWAKGL